MTTPQKITMFYDHACPVCRTEAIHMAEKNPEHITIVPIEQGLDSLAKAGISQVEAMTYLCVQAGSLEAGGKMYKGIEAVRVLHQVADTGFAKVLNFPLLKQASEVVYPIFARNRYRIPNWATKLMYGDVIADTTCDSICESGVCSLPPAQRLKT